jgi:glucose/arabinose dehydrogenase
MFVAVGSASNVDDPDETRAEFHRANILQFTPQGAFVKIYASGIRNAGGGLAINPQTGELWCSNNERDGLGDNVPPDYITHVREDGFYGWPWYYIGNHPDPRHEGKRPELARQVTAPDILLPAHNASLGMTFYDAAQFPAEYRGDLFAAQHGSWNRTRRAGYEVIRAPLVDGHATGEFQDFLTGFVLPNGNVWGRPVAVTIAADGGLLVTDDGSQSVWQVNVAER